MGQTQLEYPTATTAGVSVNIRPLPKRPTPLRDELLSSWIIRLAVANHCSVPELCGYLGLAVERSPETQEELAGVDIRRLCTITRLARSDLNKMLLVRRTGFPVECIAWSDFQCCPTCIHITPGVSLLHWRYAWSMVCQTCGKRLESVYTVSDARKQARSRLQMRADDGAKRLQNVYQSASHRSTRRISLTLQVTGILVPALRHGPLFSQDRGNRYATLAALSVGFSRPLLAAALALKNVPEAETRLRDAFPYKRNLLHRLVRIAETMPSSSSRADSTGRPMRLKPQPRASLRATSRPEYLAAAKQAIAQLGETADRGELLQCAQTILERHASSLWISSN